MLVLPGPVVPAHEIGRFGCVLTKLRAMVCSAGGCSLALLNASVRGARLQLAVARGRQKLWDRFGENSGSVSTLEVILGVLDTPDMRYARWKSPFHACLTF